MLLWNALRGGPVLALAASLVAIWASVGADAPPPGNLVVVDSAGKEHKIKGWKFAVGTRRLTWLAVVADKKEDKAAADLADKLRAQLQQWQDIVIAKAKKGEKLNAEEQNFYDSYLAKKVDKAPAKGPRILPGPEALEFRDDKSTNWQEGVITLIPVDRLRSIDYDAEKQQVTVKVAISDKPEDDQALTGTTRFKGTNKLSIEAEVDRGDMGVADVKFLGGQAGGVKGLRFAAAKAGPAVAGRSAAVTVADKMGKNTQNVVELQALYRLPDGTERLQPTLMFKKTFKLDLAKVQKITAPQGATEPEWTLKLADGEEQTLTLLKTTMIDDKPATLEGLLGKVPAGYKLFPPHAITEIVFQEK